MIGRALAPYPPVVVSFEGAGIAPANVTNLVPIDVVWKKRDRLNTAIVFPSAADEAVETGTEYVVRHGPPGFETETVLGDDSDTTGSFSLDFSGFNHIEFFARRDGYESQAFKFDTTAANGAGASVAGDIPDITVSMLIVATPKVTATGALPTVTVIYAETAQAAGDIDTITVSAVNGSVTISADMLVGLPTISMDPVNGNVTVTITGTIGTIVMTAPAADAGPIGWGNAWGKSWGKG